MNLHTLSILIDDRPGALPDIQAFFPVGLYYRKGRW